MKRLYKFLDFLAISWALKRNVHILPSEEMNELELSRLTLSTIKSQILENSLNSSAKLKMVKKTLGLPTTKKEIQNEKAYPY